MLDVLKSILCAILGIAYWVADLFMMMFNAIIAALGALLAAIVLLLPGFPDPPDEPGSQIVGYANWLFPIGGAVAILLTATTLWLVFLGWRVALNWIKAL